MATPKYSIHSDVKFRPLERIDVPRLIPACRKNGPTRRTAR
jgi:hypothetical protein